MKSKTHVLHEDPSGSKPEVWRSVIYSTFNRKDILTVPGVMTWGVLAPPLLVPAPLPSPFAWLVASLAVDRRLRFSQQEPRSARNVLPTNSCNAD